MRFVSQEPFLPRSTLPSIRAGLAIHQEAPCLPLGSSELRGGTSQQEALSRSCSQVEPAAQMESGAPARAHQEHQGSFRMSKMACFQGSLLIWRGAGKPVFEVNISFGASITLVLWP